MPMRALLFQGSDHTFHHAILLWAVRGDELLLQTVAPYQRRVFPAGEDQAIVGAQQERGRHPAQRAEARDQGVLQRTAGRRCLTASGQMPAQQLAGMAVDHQCQRCPSIPACPDPAQVRRPPLIGCLGDRRQRLDSWPEADRALSHLPALELEDALNGVFIEAQQMRHRAIAERRRLFDHGLDRLGQLGIELRCRLHRPVIDSTSRHVEPAAKLAQRHFKAVITQALLDRENHFSSSPSRACSFFRARNSSIASP